MNLQRVKQTAQASPGYTVPNIFTIPLNYNRADNAYLTHLTFRELDSSGNSSQDLVQAYVAVPGANGMLLAQEIISFGAAEWEGKFRIEQPLVIVVTFVAPAASAENTVDYSVEVLP